VHYQHQFIGSKTRQSSTCATKQSEQDSKDTDAINNCLRKVQVKKLFCNTLQKKEKSIDTSERLKAFTLDGRKFHT